MKKGSQVVFGLIISIFFLWLTFRKTEIGQVLRILKQTQILFLIFSLSIGIISLFIRSYRWKLLGKSYNNIRWKYFFQATTMGLMLNIFLPFRTGDFFQSYFLARYSGLPQSYTLTTVFLERLIDFVPPVIVILVGSTFLVIPQQFNFFQGIFLLLTIVGILFILFLKFQNKIYAFFSKFLNIRNSERLQKILTNISDAIVFLKDPQVIQQAFPLTIFIWTLYAVGNLLLLYSLGIRLNFWSSFLIQSITVMSVVIPASPGYVGTWEFFGVLALKIFKVEESYAISFVILSHFLALLPTTVFGLFYLCKGFFWKKFYI